MLTSKMENALNGQINAELWSSYLYLSMSLSAAHNGLPGISHWMYLQSMEEQSHARRLQLYMLSQDATVELRPIGSVTTEWRDARDMLHVAYMHEIEVSSMIEELMHIAEEERDYATRNCLQWFVNEQVEEEQQIRDILATLDMIVEDSCGLYLVDQSLLKREK